jgi:hypothetical protein
MQDKGFKSGDFQFTSSFKDRSMTRDGGQGKEGRLRCDPENERAERAERSGYMPGGCVFIFAEVRLNKNGY